MKNGEKTWEVEIGEWKLQKEKAELEWNPNKRIWKLTTSSNIQVICISSIKWCDKGCPMTQIVFTDAKERKEVFFEILEKKFNEEFYYPKELDETAKKITELCKTVLDINTNTSDTCMVSSVRRCTEKLLLEQLSENVKCIHVYYGNGLFFGMKRKLFNKEIERIKVIPMRCRESPLKNFLDSISN